MTTHGTTAKRNHITQNGYSFDLDPSRIAVWERFLPYQARQASVRHYQDFKQGDYSDSLTKRIRYLSLATCLTRVLEKNLVGDVGECGCFEGHSTYLISNLLRTAHFSGEFFVFDSFEGLPSPTEEDLVATENAPDIKPNPNLKKGSFAASLDQTKDNIGNSFPFLRFLPGWFPSRFPEVSDRTFQFVNVDVDLYRPTLDSLNFFYPRLVEGGVIHIDDYNFSDWPGCQKAVDDFRKENKYSFFYEVPLGGAFLLK